MATDENLPKKTATERLASAFEKGGRKRLDPKVKRDWVAALRSGEYAQLRGMLHGGGVGRCCLGVLCEVVGVPDSTGWKDQISYIDRARLLAYDAGAPLDWAPDFMGLGREVHDALSTMNDTGTTFEQIATAIEEVL